MVFDPKKVKIARQLVFPTLKLEIGREIFVRVREAMHLGRAQEAKAGEQQRGPATLLPVTVLHAGKDHELNDKDAIVVAPKLLVGYLTENYADDSYVAKAFKIVKGEKRKGKSGDYSTFDVAEIDA